MGQSRRIIWNSVSVPKHLIDDLKKLKSEFALKKEMRHGKLGIFFYQMCQLEIYDMLEVLLDNHDHLKHLVSKYDVSFPAGVELVFKSGNTKLIKLFKDHGITINETGVFVDWERE